MSLVSNVVYIPVNKVAKSLVFLYYAQRFMPVGKTFGAIVWGQSGLGKSMVTDNLNELFSNVVKGEPVNMFDVDLSCAAPEDFGAIPAIDQKTGIAKRISIAPVLPAGYGIVRADEIDRPSRPETLESFIKWAIDKTIDHAVPASYFIVGLANGVSDENTVPLDEHMRGRMVHLYVSANGSEARQSSAAYWDKRNAPDYFKRFTEARPIATRDEFEAHAVDNGRTRDYALAILKAYDEFGTMGIDLSDVILPCLAGVVGIAPASELLRFHSMSSFPSIDEVLAQPDNAKVPDDLSLATRYVAVLVREINGDCDKAKRLVKYIRRYPREIARYALEILMLACPEIASTKEYRDVN